MLDWYIQGIFAENNEESAPRKIDRRLQSSFSAYRNDSYGGMTQLLSLDNFRENEQLSKYGDMVEARGVMMTEQKKLIEANPVFHAKLAFPSLQSSRLRALINQSLNWQHHLCGNHRPYPDTIKTLYTDHWCGSSNGSLAAPTVNFPAAGSANPTSFAPLGVYTMQPFPVPASAANPTALAGWCK